jgi:Flp pilus assembly protein protease CpaA
MELYILYTILVIASVWDLITYKIPNALCMIGILAGVGYSGYVGGITGVLLSLACAAIIFVCFLPAWMFFGMGAGDVKLLMVLSSFSVIGNTFLGGFTSTIRVGFNAIFLAAFLFLFLVPWKNLAEVFRSYLYLLFYKIAVLSSKHGKKKLPFAVMILIGFVLEKHFQ